MRRTYLRQWSEQHPDASGCGVTEAMDEVARSMRCLVYWVLLPALCVMTVATFVGLVWLAGKIGG